MAHIILLEPDRMLAEIYREMFEKAGHSVIPCASAQAAVFAADQQSPDVVVMELQLIEHSGLEFLYEFRSYLEWSETPVIIHTHVPAGEFSANWQLLRTQLTVSNYLYKPVTTLHRLLQSVERQL